MDGRRSGEDDVVRSLRRLALDQVRRNTPIVDCTRKLVVTV